MGMLEGQVEFVIGVDTHRDTHTAAVCDPTGAVLVHATVATTTAGHRQLLGLAQRQASGRRVWAVEGTGSFGAGLTSLLVDHGERGGRGGSAQAASPTQRRQERCAGRDPGRPGGAGPRASGPAARPWRP